jgi:hypothetical protein
MLVNESVLMLKLQPNSIIQSVFHGAFLKKYGYPQRSSILNQDFPMGFSMVFSPATEEKSSEDPEDRPHAVDLTLGYMACHGSHQEKTPWQC